MQDCVAHSDFEAAQADRSYLVRASLGCFRGLALVVGTSIHTARIYFRIRLILTIRELLGCFEMYQGCKRSNYTMKRQIRDGLLEVVSGAGFRAH